MGGPCLVIPLVRECGVGLYWTGCPAASPRRLPFPLRAVPLEITLHEADNQPGWHAHGLHVLLAGPVMRAPSTASHEVFAASVAFVDYAHCCFDTVPFHSSSRQSLILIFYTSPNPPCMRKICSSRLPALISEKNLQLSSVCIDA